MGQKVSPIGFRTGVTIGWKSRWYAPKSNFGEFLVEDTKIRKYIDDRLNRQPPYAAISCVEIERTREELKVFIKTARPGLVIGPRGAEVDKLREALEDLTNRRVNINILEINNPDLDAQLVAEGISEQLKRRASFRRALRQRADGTMQAGAKGVKIQVSGRLGGAEMSRSETVILGSIPLHTLEADVDYGFCPCFTTYGTIGVKVWIYRGLFGDEATEADQVAAQAMTRARRRREAGSRPGDGPGQRGGARRGGRGRPGGPGGPGGPGRSSASKPRASRTPRQSAPKAKKASKKTSKKTPVEPVKDAPTGEAAQSEQEDQQTES